MRIRLSVEGGGGRARPHWPMAGPRGQDCQAAPPPPWPTGGIARGPKAPPHSPPAPPLPHRPKERAGGRPPHPPPPHPPQLGSHRRGPPPPQGRGGAPTHRRNGDTVRATAAGPAPGQPTPACRSNAHNGTRRRPRPARPSRNHSPLRGDRGGVCRSAGAPRGPVHGPPLTPPHPGAALQPRPHAPAGREHASDTERARKGYRRPPPGTRAGRPRRDTPPEAGGMGPPHPRGGPECDPPPRSSRRLTWGPRRTSGPTPAHRDAAQIVPREAG